MKLIPVERASYQYGPTGGPISPTALIASADKLIVTLKRIKKELKHTHDYDYFESYIAFNVVNLLMSLMVERRHFYEFLDVIFNEANDANKGRALMALKSSPTEILIPRPPPGLHVREYISALCHILEELKYYASDGYGHFQCHEIVNRLCNNIDLYHITIDRETKWAKRRYNILRKAFPDDIVRHICLFFYEQNLLSDFWSPKKTVANVRI